MGKLNDTLIRSLKPADKDKKYYDGGGLFLLITKAGNKSWRIKYRFNQKEQTYTIGLYPNISLADARKELLRAKEQLAQNINPMEHKKAIKQAVRAETENAFEIIALEYLETHANKWKPSHKQNLIKRLKNNIFPYFANTPVHTITPPQLLEALRKIEERGATETAHRTKNIVGQVFRYAIATGRAERDITADLKGALSTPTERHFPTITDPKQIGLLLINIDECTSGIVVKTALQVAPYVFVRPSELRCAEWSEFDFDNAEWRIPAERMKMGETHIVPLAPQVISKLKALHVFTGHSKYLFPSTRSITRPIAENALLVALRSMGYSKDEIVVHGFRSMASTLLNEQGYNRDWIERQLAHGERNKVRASYNYAQYLPDRRKMMIEWANYLDSLKEGA